MQYIFLQFLIPFSCVFIRLDSSSQAIFGHRRPALEARSICHVECCAVETSLDVSRPGEEAQEPRVSRHAMLRALLFLWLPAQVRLLEDRNQRASISFSSTMFHTFHIDVIQEEHELRSGSLKNLPIVSSFFDDFVNSFKLPLKQYVFAKY